MNSINKVILSGHLGLDPILKTSKTGISYVKINLATHHPKKGQDDQWESKTYWHNVLVFGKNAKSCQDYLKKGMPIAVEGTLSTYESVTDEGIKKKSVSVLADKLSFLKSDISQPVKDDFSDELSSTFVSDLDF